MSRNSLLLLALASLTLLATGCADDAETSTGEPAPDSGGVEAPDAGVPGVESDVGPTTDAEEPEGEADSGEVTVRDTWSARGVCAVDRAYGPVVVFMESAEPAGCVRVVFEQSDEAGAYDINVDVYWRTRSVVVSSGACSGQLTALDTGVPATEASGSADLSQSPLGSPEGLASADFELLFPADADNPFGEFIARFTVAEGEELPIEECAE